MGFLSSKKKDMVTGSELIERGQRTYGNEINKVESKTHIGKTLKIKGQVSSRENMTVEGWIKGAIRISKTLTVEREGKVKADIEAESLDVKGRVKGNIDIANKLEILNEGICEGNIKTDKLVVREGGILLGNVNLEGDVSKINIDDDEIDEPQPVLDDIPDEEVVEEIIEAEVIEKDETDNVENDIDKEQEAVENTDNNLKKNNKRSKKSRKTKKKA